MRNYIDILGHTLDNGELKGNRTGTRAITVFGETFLHDMSEGFPLITTKKIAFRSMCVELEGFIKGITDKRWYEDRKCKFWSDWCSPWQKPHGLTKEDEERWQKLNPDLGHIYGAVWNDFEGITYKPVPFMYTELNKEINIMLNSDDPNKIVGLEFDGKYGRYTVISYDGKDKYHNCRYTVKFNDTGFIKNNLCKKQILDKKIKDKYFKTILDTASLGNLDYHKETLGVDIVEKLSNCWRSMIRRCYDKESFSYKNYGEKGCFVCNRWLICEYYISDLQKLEGWQDKINNWTEYQLDKDLSGLNYYSPETCRFITKQDNANFTSQQYYFDAIEPNGTLHRNQHGLNRFCSKFNLKTKTVEASILSGTNTHDGWKFIKKDKIKSEKQPYNQLKTVIDTLKTNPDDRRLVISAWNPCLLKYAALPPCHYAMEFVHINGVLNLTWKQRSCDMFLGIPMNIASYALLLLIVCKETGLQPGVLKGDLDDCHIYENHVPQVKEQLGRQPYELPTVDILSEGLWDWTHEKIKLNNYKSHPKLTAEVAV